MCRTIVEVLADVTLLPGKGGRLPGGGYFNPESVQIEWKARAMTVGGPARGRAGMI